jgi:aspartyl/asparaginyl beta-hydroxylase (cupin superfamily)
MIIILFIIFFFFILYILQNPTELLIPYNAIIENSYEKKVFYTEEEKRNIFPTSKILEKNWLFIQEECLNVLSVSEFKDLNNVGKNFISDEESFWEGWTTFPLRMFTKDNEENMKKCPLLSSILKKDSTITTAFFSILKPGKIIPSHYGPFKGILRYHLGILIPPKDSGDCFISVDNEIYEWEEGKGILFDETYKHFVKNETPFYRIVLFLDIKRPLRFPLLNDLLIFLMGISPYNFL